MVVRRTAAARAAGRRRAAGGGLTIAGFNVTARGTIHDDVHDPGLAREALDHLPGPVCRPLLRWLDPPAPG